MDHEDNEMMRPFIVFENNALSRTFCPFESVHPTNPANDVCNCSKGCY